MHGRPSSNSKIGRVSSKTRGRGLTPYSPRSKLLHRRLGAAIARTELEVGLVSATDSISPRLLLSH